MAVAHQAAGWAADTRALARKGKLMWNAPIHLVYSLVSLCVCLLVGGQVFGASLNPGDVIALTGFQAPQTLWKIDHLTGQNEILWQGDLMDFMEGARLSAALTGDVLMVSTPRSLVAFDTRTWDRRVLLDFRSQATPSYIRDHAPARDGTFWFLEDSNGQEYIGTLDPVSGAVRSRTLCHSRCPRSLP